MTQATLIKKVRQYRELEQQIDELEAKLEALKDDLKAEMTRRKTEELQVDIYKVRWKTVVSNKFDTKTFKLAHDDLYGQYCKAQSSQRFTIT